MLQCVAVALGVRFHRDCNIVPLQHCVSTDCCSVLQCVAVAFGVRFHRDCNIVPLQHCVSTDNMVTMLSVDTIEMGKACLDPVSANSECCPLTHNVVR